MFLIGAVRVFSMKRPHVVGMGRVPCWRTSWQEGKLTHVCGFSEFPVNCLLPVTVGVCSEAVLLPKAGFPAWLQSLRSWCDSDILTRKQSTGTEWKFSVETRDHTGIGMLISMRFTEVSETLIDTDLTQTPKYFIYLFIFIYLLSYSVLGEILIFPLEFICRKKNPNY